MSTELEQVAMNPPDPRAADPQRLLEKQGVPLVRKLAQRFAKENECGLEESDFLSAGLSAANEVTPEYDGGLDVRYTTFLFPYVDGAMRDLIRRTRFERGLESLIQNEFELAIAREGRRFAATQSDTFEVLFDPREVNQHRLDLNLSDMAKRLAATAAETAYRMRRRGTEEHQAALRDMARIEEITESTVAAMPPAYRMLWELHIGQEKTLHDAAVAMGISDATAGRYLKQIRTSIQKALAREEILDLPDVE